MSHELEMKNGKARMMYVGDTPWHGLGTKLDKPPTAAEAIKAAGLDWTVSLYPMEGLYFQNGKIVRLAADSRMVVREEDGKRLSEVGPNWTPLQNIEAFEWFNPFLQSGECSLETAGSLYDGRRIWVLAKLNREPMRIVGDDTVEKYLMLSNNHDSVRSARVSLSPIRTVCANTLAMTFSDSRSKFLGIRHSDKIRENLEKVREIINTANADFEATAEQYRALTTRQISQEDLKKYVKLVFKTKRQQLEEEVGLLDEKEEDEAETAESTEKETSRNILNKVIPLFEDGIGADMPGVKGTFYQAYQAVNEWLNYQRGRSQDARLDNLWFGQSAKLNQRALEVALDMFKKAA